MRPDAAFLKLRPFILASTDDVDSFPSKETTRSGSGDKGIGVLRFCIIDIHPVSETGLFLSTAAVMRPKPLEKNESNTEKYTAIAETLEPEMGKALLRVSSIMETYGSSLPKGSRAGGERGIFVRLLFRYGE